MKQLMLVLAAMILHFPGAASQFTTLCAPGHSTHTPSEGKFTPPFVRKNLDSCYLGKVNSSHCCAFLWAQLPTNFCTSVELVCPVASGGTIADANIDLWFLGIENTLGNLSYEQKVYWHTWDDATPVRTNGDGAYTYLLDGRFPVKIQDNAISAGTKITGGSVPVFRPEGLMTQIGLSFNRGAKMGDYMLIRFNPDRLDMNGQLRFAGGTTEVVAQSNLLAGAELYPAQKICYSAPDGVPVPQPRLSAAEQAGESYVRSTVNWVQYRDGDGGRGFSYPAYCGVKNGKTRDLYFTIDAPAYTLTNGWLTLTALPPLTGTIPAGARVSLSLAGFADGPAAHTDFVVTDGMFEGQTPVLLQENVLDGGVWAGKSLLSRAVAQRNLIRALNARVLASSDVWAEDRGGKLAVFRLAVEATGGTEDWGFSVGSAATPGVASFFEAVEYRKMLVVRLPNSDFESGFSNWSQTPADATANQISVVADPLDAANHCLRFKNVDTPTRLLSVSQWMNDDALVRKLRSRRMRQSCRAYFPKKLERRSDRLTLYGHFYLVSKNENKSNMNVMSMRWADDYRSAGVWQTVTAEKVFPADQTTGFSFDIRFNCHEPCDVNLGDEAYIDDLELVCEDFWEYPAEKPGLYLFVL